ncbi:MAG: SDR family NAD(P)-dependent oxidoreductase [Caldilineaceae bacterium SB0675_bin_29]|uniref:SDR family NAD(P)-dependent oxidoreductase n=1 Tax=Caldilineaceae bacterium SB0675_bin_29 TaxID=2605266 RepID=A0A6B1GB33_9CHLR|nr:SDR family NAD(P)-dependent oxidoreductase [Caldilineaceae bacterium SB0675_bin_29]
MYSGGMFSMANNSSQSRARWNRELGGKVAVVTGASRGIGEAIAVALAAEGCRLVLAARSTERLQEIAEGMRLRHSSEVLVVPTDIGDEGQSRALVSAAADHFGTVDILVNNAGMGIFGAMDELHLDDLRHVFAVNFFGPMAALQAAVPIMRGQGGGTIVNVSSIVGRLPQPLGGGYTATKFALHGASGAARAELKRDNIDVVLVCPGLTDTEFSQHSRISVPGAEHRQGERHSLGRGVDPERVGRRTVTAIKKGEREVFITLFDRALVWFAAHFPALLQWVLVYVTRYRRRRFEEGGS